jgi:hypothetical protein
MSPGSGAEFCRSDHVILEYRGGEAGPHAHYAGSGSEHYRSGS